ncbi:DNA-directed RNA polymerase subunit delta [Mycoplasmopsis iners]|uniref:DNA-directed RNA polymerase subunit delta n=1 Tax=Mycoplasmopsis iners TaxID=76630 RepID=UPI000494FBEF|nr:hypothetical protein [Mycoplasmopsis iners]
MKTMLDIILDYAKVHCNGHVFITFDEFFGSVESELKAKWELEAEEKSLSYEQIRLNKIGELYRLLTVDSRFVRNEQGNWSTRIGFK